MLGSALCFQQESETHDASKPDQSDPNRDAIEISLRHRGSAHTGGHAAAEHVGEAAALSAVQQHEQDQQQAGDDLDPDDDGGEHEVGSYR